VQSVLFLCTGNSARSIMAEVMMNHLGRGRYTAYSAGSHPTGKVNPHAVEALHAMGFGAEGLRSKNWDEFAAPGAPAIDYVITVCDNAAGEACPVWPGKPTRGHWGVEDPASAEGSDAERRAAFRDTAAILRQRIERFLETGAT
jgi:arsenate reductase